jgi:calcineurin-like phosphoesterase family protein
MSCLWHTSDWHLGHRNILKYREGPFKTREELEALLEQNFNDNVTKRDTTYFHGDMCFDHASLEVIKRLKGIKILILGNHDEHIKTRTYLEVFDDVVGPIKKNGFWLSHHPIYEGELYGKPNIHGHTHNQSIYSSEGNLHPMYYNVSVDATGFKPVKFQDIVTELSTRKY